MVFCNMIDMSAYILGVICHNPYFNRWFSAINISYVDFTLKELSQSLF